MNKEIDALKYLTRCRHYYSIYIKKPKRPNKQPDGQLLWHTLTIRGQTLSGGKCAPTTNLPWLANFPWPLPPACQPPPIGLIASQAEGPHPFTNLCTGPLVLNKPWVTENKLDCKFDQKKVDLGQSIFRGKSNKRNSDYGMNNKACICTT